LRDVPGALPLTCVLPTDLSESLAFFLLVPATFSSPQAAGISRLSYSNNKN